MRKKYNKKKYLDRPNAVCIADGAHEVVGTLLARRLADLALLEAGVCVVSREASTRRRGGTVKGGPACETEIVVLARRALVSAFRTHY